MAFIQLDTDVPHIPPKPTVIGLYGLPGSGKSFLLKQLKTELGEQRFVYYEGSTVISSLVPGGLEAFKQSDNQQKNSIRERAIRQIAEECSTTRRVGVVAGHFLFWDVADGKVAGQPPQSIWTGGDAETYTHIFYLEVPANVVLQRRQNDTARERPTVSVEHLDEWQQSEIKQLRDVCLEHGIHFSTIPPSKVSEVPTLLRDIEEQCNLSRAKYQLDTNLRYLSDKTVSDTVLVFDGDRTLISEDTGALFVKLMLDDGLVSEDPLKAAFTSLGYSYAAFRRVALVYDALSYGKPEGPAHSGTRA